MNGLFCVMTDKGFVSARSFCPFLPNSPVKSRFVTVKPHVRDWYAVFDKYLHLYSFNNHLLIYAFTKPIWSLSYPSLFHLLIVGVEVYCCA
jgi:hypothetical protein